MQLGISDLADRGGRAARAPERHRPARYAGLLLTFFRPAFLSKEPMRAALSKGNTEFSAAADVAGRHVGLSIVESGKTLGWCDSRQSDSLPLGNLCCTLFAPWITDAWNSDER
jgi:hypothetical protein